MPVMRGKGAEALDALISSASAQTMQRNSGEWQAPENGYLCVLATGGDVLVATGEDAVGSDARVGAFCFDGLPVFVSIRQGEAVSVVDG